MPVLLELEEQPVAALARELRLEVDRPRLAALVVTQISAIQAARDKVALGLLDAHARHCIVDGHAEGIAPEDLTDELMAAVGRLMRPG